MKVAVLPFNATGNASPALGRQLANFATDSIRAATGTEDLQNVNFLTQIESEDGVRAAYVNVAEGFVDIKLIRQMFDQSEVDAVVDGVLEGQENGKLALQVRFHRRDQTEPVVDERIEFEKENPFQMLASLVRRVGSFAEIRLPEPLTNGKIDFGTQSGVALLKFFEGYDSMLYIQQTNGRVAREFQPKSATDVLIEACRIDPDFLGPSETLIQLCRLCAQHKIGTFEETEAALKALLQLVPDDWQAHFALGEVYQSINDAQRANDSYEKAAQLNPQEPALLTRLGLTQLALGMPANAERNFRKALEMEGDDKPSLDHLAIVLQQTNRAHEIPLLWKEQIKRNPNNPEARAKYALGLLQAGQEQEGLRAFDEALEQLEDTTLVKRLYAPVLAQRNELDRAMDFYEDCLEVAPTDVALLLEYAQTLKVAGREFEVPKVLRDSLACNPDPSTRANVLAWLIELEQPQRVKMVEKARQLAEKADFRGTVEALKPLRNWLADYWKMWILLAAALNRVGEHEEAEQASKRLIELFPLCEPAYAELNAALHEQGKDEEAFRTLGMAGLKMPQSLVLHVNLALAAKRSGHLEEASILAKQIRASVGPNPEVEQALKEIE